LKIIDIQSLDLDFGRDSRSRPDCLGGGMFSLSACVITVAHRHRSSAAPTVRRLPSAACAATPPFDVWSLGLYCGWPSGLDA